MTRPTRPPSAETLARESHVLELRRAGVSFPRIAEELGLYDRSEAHKIYRRALNRVHAEPAAEIRDLEADRLDRLQVKVWTKALSGDLHAVDRVLRIMERRSKLLGLDHADGIAEQAIIIEAAKVRLMAVGVAQAYDWLVQQPGGEAVEQHRAGFMEVLVAGMRTAEDEDEHDVVTGQVIEP